MRISIILVKLIFIGALLIIANHNLHLNNPIEREVFYSEFFGWFDNLYQSSLGIVGYVARSEWLPSNVSVETSNESK